MMNKAIRIALPLCAALACAERSTLEDTAITGDTSATSGQTAAATTGAMIDPNTATQQQLASVPGLDSSAAAALVAGRPYADMIGVDRVLAGRNLTADQRRTAYAALWKPINLNTATDAEILLIPGIGQRMLHEFKEYRPYTSIEQFRREMGKYVDDDEVARLQKYVSIS